MDTTNEQTRQEDHAQDDNDEQPHERTGAEGALFKESPRKRVRHRRRLPECLRGRQ